MGKGKGNPVKALEVDADRIRGRFAPGNQVRAYANAIYGPTNAPCSPTTNVRHALVELQQRLPAIIRVAADIAMDTLTDHEGEHVPVDVAQRLEAARYCIDRIYGRPTQPLSLGNDPTQALLARYLAVVEGRAETLSAVPAPEDESWRDREPVPYVREAAQPVATEVPLPPPDTSASAPDGNTPPRTP